MTILEAAGAADAPSDAMIGGVMVFSIVIWLILIVMYFVPTIVAVLRKHRQTGPIAAVNVLLGWTVIGWIGSFIWALTTAQATTQTIIVHTQPQSGAATDPKVG